MFKAFSGYLRSNFAVGIARALIYIGLYLLVSCVMEKPAFPGVSALSLSLWKYFNRDNMSAWISTLARWSAAFVLGSMCGCFVGILLGAGQWTYRMFNFDLNFFRSLPATVLVSFLLAAFGLNEVTGAFPAVYITIFTVAYYVSEQVKDLDKTRVMHLRRLGAGWRFIAINCLVYEISPGVLTAIGQALSLSFLVQVSAEMIIGSAGNRGLGNALIDWKDHMDYAELIISIAFLGSVGYLVNFMMNRLRARLMFWDRIDASIK